MPFYPLNSVYFIRPICHYRCLEIFIVPESGYVCSADSCCRFGRPSLNARFIVSHFLLDAVDLYAIVWIRLFYELDSELGDTQRMRCCFPS